MARESDDQKLDIAKLNFLLFQFEQIISEIIENKSWFKNEDIYSLISEIWQTEKDKISVLTKELYNGQHYQMLKTAGLTGKQLDLKFLILSYFLYGGIANVDFLDKHISRFTAPTKLPPLTKRIIAGFFDFFNSLLGSLCAIIPMTESIKEFKDMVHFEIEYGLNRIK